MPNVVAERIVEVARRQGLTLATAESVTGGLIAAALTDVPGASTIFAGGMVAYTAEAKRELLGVGAELIASRGVVSQEVARAMAEGARGTLGVDCAVATTGVAGPEPHVGQAPGVVCVAAAGPPAGRDLAPLAVAAHPTLTTRRHERRSQRPSPRPCVHDQSVVLDTRVCKKRSRTLWRQKPTSVARGDSRWRRSYILLLV